MRKGEKANFWDMLAVYIFWIYATGVAFTLIFLGTFGLRDTVTTIVFIMSVSALGLSLSVLLALRIIKEAKAYE